MRIETSATPAATFIAVMLAFHAAFAAALIVVSRWQG